ncbi:hypothetical protein DICVIV_13176 [Dictyocaulus viviparus]|uniref:Uncharacterized protein n=1 Tax=Dictyocaulus viviparus TaxID=29172 RepID=A0A0D8X8I8_DICVI|nr:hypothetical protein DICVIV_13176 [Dictyocaulus viviparus]
MVYWDDNKWRRIFDRVKYFLARGRINQHSLPSMKNMEDFLKITTSTLFLGFCCNLPSVLACGTDPFRTEKTLKFTVSNFNVPVEMAYSTEDTVRVQAPSIRRRKEDVEMFVDSLVKEAVTAVFEEEGRNYFLLPAVVTAILDQITVKIQYDPILCNKALVDQPLNTNLQRELLFWF